MPDFGLIINGEDVAATESSGKQVVNVTKGSA